MDKPIEADQRYTYADYLTWDDDVRRELIDGVIYVMSAPTWEHQRINGNLFMQIAVFLKGKPCKVFSAPFDVRLNADDKDDTVVQPDIVVICDRTKLIGTGCVNAPDMAVEVLSPSTTRRDRLEKLNLYQKYGVREYWVVDPDDKTVSVHFLENGKYVIYAYGEEDVAPVRILESCDINLKDVFDI